MLTYAVVCWQEGAQLVAVDVNVARVARVARALVLPHPTRMLTYADVC